LIISAITVNLTKESASEESHDCAPRPRPIDVPYGTPDAQFLNTPAQRFANNSIKVSATEQNSRTARTTLLLESARSRLARAQQHGGGDVLGIIAAVLIILWLLGFFAFHVTAGFIHIVLVVGLILLVLHFMRRA
jgi:hypothetical protein